MEERRLMDVERLARLETRMDGMRDQFSLMSETMETIADGIAKINLALATDNGFRRAIGYALNGLIGLGGVLTGYLGFGKHS